MAGGVSIASIMFQLLGVVTYNCDLHNLGAQHEYF